MTIYGLDFSHYDAVPSGARVVSEGFSFMTHKAGGDKDDAELGAWWSALKGQRGKVLLGAYWVLYPGNPTGRADAFLARLDSQCPGWRDGPFILQLDCEVWNGDTSTQPHLGDIKSACDRLKSKMPKLRPIVYASAGQYGNSLSGLGYPLWNARYPSSLADDASTVYGHIGGDGGPGWDSYSGQTPAIWQFTSSATALGQTTCDANAFRGTLDELTALVAPGWQEETFMAFIDNQADFSAALTAWAKTDAGADAIGNAVANHTELDPDSTTTPQGTGRLGGWWRMDNSRSNARQAQTVGLLSPLADAVGRILTNVTADDGEAQQILAAIQAAQAGTADAVVDALVGRSDAEVAAALIAALGPDRAAAVANAIDAAAPDMGA